MMERRMNYFRSDNYSSPSTGNFHSTPLTQQIQSIQSHRRSQSSTAMSYDPDRRPMIFYWANNDPPSSSSKSNDEQLENAKKGSSGIVVEVPRKDLSVKGKDRIRSSRIFARDIARRRPIVYEKIARRLIRNYEVLLDFERLVREFGHSPVPVSLLQAGDAHPPFRKQMTTFGDFLVNVRQQPQYAGSHYLQQVSFEKYLPQLIAASELSLCGPCHLSHYLKKEYCNGPTLFIGAKGTRTSLHYDRSVELPAAESVSESHNHSNSNGQTKTEDFRKPSTATIASNSSSTITTHSTHSSSTSSSSKLFYYLSPTTSASNSNSNGTTALSPATLSLPSIPLPSLMKPAHSIPTNSSSSSTANNLPSTTTPEYDIGKHNLFLQLSGSRRFVLFPEECSDDLLPSKGTPWPQVSKSLTFVHTVLDYSSNYDLQLQYLTHSPYPSLAKAWPYHLEVILQPGEVLFIPAKWWHCMEILQSGSGINWWFLPDPEIEEKIRQHTHIIEVPAELLELEEMKRKRSTNHNHNHNHHSSSNSQEDLTVDQSNHSILTYSSQPSTSTGTGFTHPYIPSVPPPSIASTEANMRSKESIHTNSNGNSNNNIGQVRRKVYTNWDAVENNCPIS